MAGGFDRLPVVFLMDKPEEGRAKLPLRRWRFSGQLGRLEFLPDLDAIGWSRLGDISAYQASHLTP